ncbi:MAG: KDP operon transcriptional regulatory protein KdpE [Gemmatimonadaceae bacterium]|nr:KDP operon transcriptional regulatory protein KdpE [Gemmatimonadaceae bacterium]
MTTVLLIEDNETLALGLRSNLEYEGFRVLVAPDARTGRSLIAAERPDLVILDLMLPDTHGYHLLRSLRDGGDQTPVLILTALGEETDKVRGFRFGADDYVTKPFGLMELLARVNALLRRSQRLNEAAPSVLPATSASPAIAAFGDVTIDHATRTVTRTGTEVALRPREFDLLAALVRRTGQVASRLDLLREVWGYDDSVMSRTVDTHIAELRRKLERDPAHPEHILTVLKTGYRIRR